MVAPHVTAQLHQDTARLPDWRGGGLLWWRALGDRTARIQADSTLPPPLPPSLLATVCVTKSDTAHTPPYRPYTLHPSTPHISRLNHQQIFPIKTGEMIRSVSGEGFRNSFRLEILVGTYCLCVNVV